MRSWKYWKRRFSFALYLKCASVLFLFTLGVLIVACGNTGQVDPGNAAVATIDLNGFRGSPIPPLPDYLCGAWVTNSSPAFAPNGVISVFAKFVHTVGGNPVGVDGAEGAATVLWPDGSSNTVSATTTSDGLIVFPVVLKATSINKVVLVRVTFSKQGVPSCTTPQPAYFTAILMSSPTVTKDPTPSTPTVGTGTPTRGSPTATPGITVTPGHLTPIVAPPTPPPGR